MQTWRDRLSHVRWIGGPPDAGKTTVALLLAEWFGVPVYRQDGRERAHFERATPASHPENAATWQLIVEQGEAAFFQSWVESEPAILARQARTNWAERIDFVCDDLGAFGIDSAIVAEGSGFFPDVIGPLLSHPGQAIWLIPTEDFKRHSHRARDKSRLRFTTSDPERFLEHHIARDLIFADEFRREVTAAGLPWIEIDGSEGPEEVARRVARHFGLE